MDNTFKHTALDLGVRSIRLIRVLPSQTDDESERIRCSMRSATLEDDYSCLSYVWGKSRPGKWIQVDGKELWVRQNLWNFLNVARARSDLQTWFWIDALSIDQDNVVERQHQVQQMGLIFSSAKMVYAWFGQDARIARFLAATRKEQSIVQNPSSEQHYAFTVANAKRIYPWFGTESDLVRLRNELAKPRQKARRVRKEFEAFAASPYWNRAWITQEIALAQDIILLAGGELCPLEALSHYQYSDEYSAVLQQIAFMRPTGRASIGIEDQQDILKNKSLVSLLSKFKDRQCLLRRDRVFSLLALCGEGADVEVDYTIPEGELVWNVLRRLRHSLCLCSICIVGDVLGISAGFDGLLILPESTNKVSGFARLIMPVVRTTASPTLPGPFRSYVLCTQSPVPTWLEIRVDMEEICLLYAGWMCIRNPDAGEHHVFPGSPTPHTDQHLRDEVLVNITADARSCVVLLSITYLLQKANDTSMYHRRPADCCFRSANRHYYREGAGQLMHLVPYDGPIGTSES